VLPQSLRGEPFFSCPSREYGGIHLRSTPLTSAALLSRLSQDCAHKYFEVILVDPQHKAIRNDPRIQWIVNPVHKHRELRGLTSAGRAARGLRKRGHKANKIIGSSWRGNWKRRQYLSLRRYR
jgi:ribosomal protein L15E